MQVFSLLFEAIFGAISGLFDMLFDLAINVVPTRRNTLYNADFAKTDSILKIAGGGNDGFCVSKWSNSIHESHSHMIVFGSSGSHKSTSVVFPTILHADNMSIICHDPSREIYNATASALKERGYAIKVLDYNNPSEGFNVLAKCQSISDVHKIANVLVRNTLEGSNADFWSQSAEALIALFARYLVTYSELQYRTLANVLNLINVFSYAPKKVDELIVRTGDQQLISEYKSLVVLPDKTLLSVVATAKTALAVYSNPTVSLVTSFDSIDFESFRKEKTALFICSVAHDAQYYKAISATFFEMLFGSILSKIPTKNELSILIILDEASSMRLTTLSSAVSLVRKHSASIGLLFQDQNQLEHLYGKYESANIVANCKMKVYMPGQPSDTSKTLEQVMGKYSYDDDGVNKTRELLTAQEIRELNKIIVLYGNKPPILLPVIPYYEQTELVKLTTLPIHQVENTLPYTIPPMLAFPDEKKD